MGRYVPSTDEQDAIDRLTLAGYAVVRQRSYDALHERVRLAEAYRDMATESRKSAETWAHRCLDEERRLSRRLDELCTAAAALGVSITDINAALDAARTKES